MLSYGEKHFSGAPFGTQSTRFDVSGVHPQRKQIGTFTEIPHNRRVNEDLVRNLGPGKYAVDAGDIQHCAAQGCAGQGWIKQREVNMPHILYREAWSNKRKLAEALGPGKYVLKTFIDVLNEKPCSVRGVCDSREERFKDYNKKCPAGPGSYGKGGVPTTLLDERRMKSSGTYATMDFSAGVERFAEQPVDCGLCPGTYKIKPFTELILEHHVGKKGPYEIFTGRRDKPINCGYLAAPRQACINPGKYYLPPMFGEDMKTPQKRYHGMFSQGERFASVPTERIFRSTLAQRPEPIHKPGPGYYSVSELTEDENRNPPPFLSSSHRFSRIGMPQQGHSCIVGPGRYSISPKVLKIQKRGGAAFKSNTQRYLTNTDHDTFGQEKLRPCNIPDRERPYHRHPDEALTCPTASF